MCQSIETCSTKTSVMLHLRDPPGSKNCNITKLHEFLYLASCVDLITKWLDDLSMKELMKGFRELKGFYSKSRVKFPPKRSSVAVPTNYQFYSPPYPPHPFFVRFFFISIPPPTNPKFVLKQQRIT